MVVIPGVVALVKVRASEDVRQHVLEAVAVHVAVVAILDVVDATTHAILDVIQDARALVRVHVNQHAPPIVEMIAIPVVMIRAMNLVTPVVLPDVKVRVKTPVLVDAVERVEMIAIRRAITTAMNRVVTSAPLTVLKDATQHASLFV